MPSSANFLRLQNIRETLNLFGSFPRPKCNSRNFKYSTLLIFWLCLVQVLKKSLWWMESGDGKMALFCVHFLSVHNYTMWPSSHPSFTPLRGPHLMCQNTFPEMNWLYGQMDMLPILMNVVYPKDFSSFVQVQNIYHSDFTWRQMQIRNAINASIQCQSNNLTAKTVVRPHIVRKPGILDSRIAKAQGSSIKEFQYLT